MRKESLYRHCTGSFLKIKRHFRPQVLACCRNGDGLFYCTTNKNMRYITALLLILAISSCTTDRQDMEYVCNCKELEKVNTFVAGSIKNANNMSDEEMEDVIYELRKSGIITNCHQELLWQDGNGVIDWSRSKLDTCEIYINIWL